MKTHTKTPAQKLNQLLGMKFGRISGKATVEALNQALGTKFTYKRAASIGRGTYHYMFDGDWTVIGTKYIEEFRAEAHGFYGGRTFKAAPPPSRF
jgi:hypothetical protein